jgi:hypothetical protein
MKKILFLLLLIPNILLAQDTVKHSAFYSRIMPVSTITGAGTLPNKLLQTIEVGRSFSMLDLGLAYGGHLIPVDNTQAPFVGLSKYNFSFLEVRATMDASQYGIFSNEISIGMGYNFDKDIPCVLEITSTILAQVHKHIGIGVVVGYYDFSGSVVDYNTEYYGLFMRIGLQRSESGTLLGHKPHMHHAR